MASLADVPNTHAFLIVDSSWGLIRLNRGHLVKSTMVESLQVCVEDRVKDIKLNPWARYRAGLLGGGRPSELPLLKLLLGINLKRYTVRRHQGSVTSTH